MMHIFENGLIIGRFQIIHNGHVNMIKTALASCDRVLLFIGSSQESGTQKNPLCFLQRYNLMSLIFHEEMQSGHLIVKPLPDIGAGNNAKWGEYVLYTADKLYDFHPQLIISGKEDRRTSWFDSSIAELFIPKTINVSSTAMRDAMLNDNKAFWETYSPPELHEEYASLRQTLIESQDNPYTDSV